MLRLWGSSMFAALVENRGNGGAAVESVGLDWVGFADSVVSMFGGSFIGLEQSGLRGQDVVPRFSEFYVHLIFGRLHMRQELQKSASHKGSKDHAGYWAGSLIEAAVAFTTNQHSDTKSLLEVVRCKS
ncbi:hypothetical protein F0562_032094 [Nyssa sinensis]|uniref:Uncharacterized protein n=1 Tax=Nyssa sinensis TaxID=561372 RepID=A0A5J5AYT0_9ASTE|nr:hypothetical protein F0562_032094 [Nyssa sinensis]